MIGDWSNPFELVTPVGPLKLNWTDPATGRRFQLNPAKCSAILPVRTTDADDVPQGDGKIPHRRWFSGYGAHLAIEPWIAPVGPDPNLVDPYGEAAAACDSDLVEMLDLLGLHKNAIIRTGLVSGLPNARLIWTPSGHANRMLDRCQLQSGADLAVTEGSLGGVQVEFDIDTPYPYYISETEIDTVLYESGTTEFAVIENCGNIDGFLVVQVFGPTSLFFMANMDALDMDGNPLEFIYDAALPGAVPIGAGDYIEFDFFRGSAYLNGSGAKRMAGLDMRISEFFPLIPGDNTLNVLGASALVKSSCYWG